MRNPTRRTILKAAPAIALISRLHASSLDRTVSRPATAGSVAPASRYTWPLRQPLKANLEHALFVRNLAKRVESTLLIDDMEGDKGWIAAATVKLNYTSERAKAGTRSLRFQVEQRSEDYIRRNRLPNGSFTAGGVLLDITPTAATARLKFATPQDWSGYNRLAVWCYVHPTMNPVNTLCMQFSSEGARAGIADPIAVHYFSDMQQGQWNLLAWEIPEHQRDRVVELILFLPVSGLPFRDASSLLTYDLDQLRVERVAAESVQGWAIAPHRLAYSHVGYAAHGQKLAFSAEPPGTFELLSATSGAVAARFDSRAIESQRGRYTACDFSAFMKPGRYRLKAGSLQSEPFAIAAQVWRPLVEATLNGYYGLRCGFAVPGVHDACHCDIFVEHQGERRPIGGGWHDAANLTQDPINTHIATCALLDLHESLAPHDQPLAARALEEARWGLEWIQRMRFGPGLRNLRGGYSYYTDNIVGNEDDSIQGAVGTETFANLSAALAEVRGSMALRAQDPQLAAELLRMAEEDFSSVLQDRPEPPRESGTPNWRTTPWQNQVGYIVLTAVALFRATGKSAYAGHAARYGRYLLEMQETRFIDGAPVTGYFYEDAARTRILHEFQRTSGAPNSFEEGGPLAWQALCENFPDHPDWIRWYAALVCYSEYYCGKGAQASAPFNLLPAAVWRASDLDAPFGGDAMGMMLARVSNPLFPTPPAPNLIRRQMAELYEAGTPLTPTQRLRTFPLYVDHIRHGSSTVHLTKAIGLAAGAAVRNNPALTELLARQLQWLVGNNPFSRSLVYGVGYDWWQNFTVSLPNFVGGVAVGMNTYGGDAPAWGNNAVFPYKEVWIVTSARLAASLARLPGVARVTGRAPAGAMFRHLATGVNTRVSAGRFAVSLMPGEYTISYGGFSQPLTLTDGKQCALILDPARAISMSLALGAAAAGSPTLRLQARGTGRHRVQMRTFNAVTNPVDVELDFSNASSTAVDVALQIKDSEQPWVVVAIPNGWTDRLCEMFGNAGPLRDLSVAGA